jgi:hypothetical protein
MFNEAELVWIFATLAVAAVSLVAALFHNSKWKNRGMNGENLYKLGFVWGFFTIYSTVIGYSLFLLVLLYFGLTGNNANLESTAAVFAVLTCFLVVAWYALKRRVWALILLTLMSLNGIWMVVNFAYFRNRWDEFKQENAARKAGKNQSAEALPNANGGRVSGGNVGILGKIGEGLRKAPKDWRVVTFGSLVWSFSVLIFVFLASPYGGSYMRDDDWLHMWSVIFVPIAAIVFLYWLYKRFVA